MNLGFVGLGAMGSLIEPRLMAAGHTVTGWNRSRDKAAPLIAAGMTEADTPRAVAQNSEIVFSIVTDAKAVRAVALGPDGIVAGLKRGGIYIDMSTIEPEESRAVAAEFAHAGSIMLDGPLSGSPVTVVAGQASIMIGGDAAAYERAKPVLLAIGPKVMRIGGQGLACQMKIAINLLLMVEVIAFGEAVALAEKGGVERAVALEAVLKSVAASPVLGYRGPFILDGQMPAVPLAAAANEMMNACRGLGIDGNDFVVAHQVYRRLGGQE
jgi:3-hydroxyisobutyrate dehydrogenase-like beta-hydroxyacid dehydrogenase